MKKILVILVLTGSDALAQSVPMDVDFQKIKDQMIAERKVTVLEPLNVATGELNLKYIAALDRLIQNPGQLMKSTTASK